MKAIASRRHSTERVPPSRHAEIGTVSLPTRSWCVRVSEAKVDRCTSTAAYTMPRSPAVAVCRNVRSTSIQNLAESTPDHFLHLTNSSLVHNLIIFQISCRSTRNFSSYSSNNQLTDKRGWNHYVLQHAADVKTKFLHTSRVCVNASAPNCSYSKINSGA